MTEQFIHRLPQRFRRPLAGAAMVGVALALAPTPQADARVFVGFGFPLYFPPPLYYPPPALLIHQQVAPGATGLSIGQT